MFFAYTPDQVEIASLVREVLASSCTSDLLRTVWRSGEVPGEMLGRLGELGLPGLLVDPAHGGQGLDELFLSLVAQEIGRACVPLPISETIVAASSLPPDHQGRHAILAGTSFISIADNQLRAPWGNQAAATVIGAHLHLADQVTTEPVPTVDRTRPLHRITPVPEDTATALVDEARTRARFTLAQAAELVGLGRAMVTMTAQYVSQRQQFGAPVGSFQAIKHHLADARIQLEFASPALAEAAWRLSTDGPTAQSELWLAHARFRAGRAAKFIARTAIQCHGAMGYTTEYPLHFFAKRTWALTHDDHLDRLQHRVIIDRLGLPGDPAEPTRMSTARASASTVHQGESA